MNEEYQKWLNDRPNYKPLAKWNSGLVQEILDRHPTLDEPFSGFTHRTIVGEPGCGKSIYAYKSVAKVHYTLNGFTKVDEEEESYKFALDNMIFHPIELFDRMLYQKKILRKPALAWILDDASVHFGKQLFDMDRHTYRRLQGAMPTIRTAVTCLLITTPRIQLLAKPLREFFDKKVEIKVIEHFQRPARLARHYEKKFFPDDVRYRMRIPFQDYFSVLCPKPFFDWYFDKKIKAETDYLEKSISYGEPKEKIIEEKIIDIDKGSKEDDEEEPKDEY